MAHRNSGFTLIELMVVVAVVAIIVAIAIPTMLGGRILANEGSAIGSLRTISSVNEQYHARFSSYAVDLPTLRASELIDPVLASGQKSGYQFTYSSGAGDWDCLAEPVSPSITGRRYFFCDGSGVIRFATSNPVDSSSPAVD